MSDTIIHIVMGKAQPDRMNGVTKVVHDLARTLTERGHPVAVWGLTDQVTPVPTTPFVLRLFNQKPYGLRLDPRLVDALQSCDPTRTIIHLHGALTPCLYRIARLLVDRNIPYVISLHGILSPRSMRRGWWYKLPYLLLCETFILRHARYVHCLTAREQRDARCIAKHSRTIVIPNGADPVPPQPPAKHRDIRFLFMGRFDKVHKGLDILIDAFAIFCQAHQAGHLVLAGDGPHKHDLVARIKRHHLGQRITMLPPQFNADKSRVLNDADIFVHTSRWEAMPLSCLDAAAHGKPLLVTPETGLADYVVHHHCGWVTSTRPVHIAQTMDDAYRAWQSGQSLALGQNARILITNHLNWPHVADRFIREVYSHVDA